MRFLVNEIPTRIAQLPFTGQGLDLGPDFAALDDRACACNARRCPQTSPNANVDTQLLLICFLTFVIHLIGTLAYSVRIAGVRTRRIAVSLALFSILILVSRTSNSFLGPFLAKRVETNLDTLSSGALLGDFRWLLVSASLATVAGALLIPTFQRVFCRAVLHFQVHRSIPRCG
jgi:hypothetical protein